MVATCNALVVSYLSNRFGCTSWFSSLRLTVQYHRPCGMETRDSQQVSRFLYTRLNTAATCGTEDSQLPSTQALTTTNGQLPSQHRNLLSFTMTNQGGRHLCERRC